MSPRYTRPYAPGPYGPILLAQHLKVGSHFYLNSLCIYNTYSMSVYLSYLLSMGASVPYWGKVGSNPANIPLLGTSFQKARRAFWGEARPGFGVHWCVYV